MTLARWKLVCSDVVHRHSTMNRRINSKSRLHLCTWRRHMSCHFSRGRDSHYIFSWQAFNIWPSPFFRPKSDYRDSVYRSIRCHSDTMHFTTSKSGLNFVKNGSRAPLIFPVDSACRHIRERRFSSKLRRNSKENSTVEQTSPGVARGRNCANLVSLIYNYSHFF